MGRTIKDVANKAGVSVATVSNVINNTRFVSEDLRKKVEEAILEVGYHPNVLARGLRRGDTKSIGLVMPDNSNPFFAELAKEIEDMGFESGYGFFLCNSSSDLQREATYVNMLISKQVDGIIFIASHSDYEHLMELKDRNIPVVQVDREIPLQLGDVVLINNEKGGYEATKYLIELGHRKIACITGPFDITPSADRVSGYRRALKEAGIPIREAYILAGDFQYQSGENNLAHLLRLEDVPTAVFVCNDMMAIGAIKQAKISNVRIPEDISIVGFDDIQFVTAVSPSLTTIAQPIRELAQTAISLLMEKIQKESGMPKGKRIVLEPTLVIRESCRRIG
jgi:LacI family transcriptional regulator